MVVTVPPQLEKFIHSAVDSGRYSSVDELVSAALRLLQEREPGQEEEIAPLHAKVDDALAALTRGEGEDGEAYVENPKGELEESQEDERPVQR